MSTSAVIEPPNSTPGLSEPQRLIKTFVAPSETFRDIQRNPRWFVPYLIIALFSLAFVFVMEKQIGFDQIMQNEIAKNPAAQEKLEKLPAEQREGILQFQMTVAKRISYSTPVIVLVLYLIMAAVLLGIFNFGFATRLKFMQTMAIVTYAGLPSIFSAILGSISLFAGIDPEGFNIRNPVATNPAYFMDAGKTHVLYNLAMGFDIITIWSIFLIATGISTNSNVKRGTAFFTIFGLVLLFKLGSGALAAAFS